MVSLLVHVQNKLRHRKYTRHLSTNLFKRIANLLIILIILIGLNSAAMMFLEGMSLGDSLWLSATTVTTVGYGDFSPSTALGRAITIGSLYILAIAILSQLVGEFIDWRTIKSEKLRLGEWEFKNMEGHIQIINTPNTDTEKYLDRLLDQIRKTPDLRDLPVQLLTRKFPDGIPSSLKKHQLLHRTGEAENTDNLRSVSIDRAAFIIILARECGDSISDSLTFDVLSRIKEIGTRATIIVEAVNDNNRQRFADTGADVIIRPIRAYPELVVRSMTDPGTEQVIENIVNHSGGRLIRVELNFEDKIWSEIQCSIIQQDQGTPVAYINASGGITIPDSNKALCSGKGIISLVSDQQSVSTPSYN